MNKYIKELSEKDIEFQQIIKPLISNTTVQQMENYRQHYETSCFDHCYCAAYYCYLICKKYNLDYKSATRAAMLHDLFLYDWRVRQPDRKGLHAFTHGKVACNNACKLFDLNEKEKDIILISPTGSGKTIAFLLPVLQGLDPLCKEIQALILVPSRELAMQINSISHSISSGYKINCC